MYTSTKIPTYKPWIVDTQVIFNFGQNDAGEREIDISFYNNHVNSQIESLELIIARKILEKNERDEMNILRNLAFCRKRNWENSIFSTIRGRLEFTLGIV